MVVVAVYDFLPFVVVHLERPLEGAQTDPIVRRTVLDGGQVLPIEVDWEGVEDFLLELIVEGHVVEEEVVVVAGTDVVVEGPVEQVGVEVVLPAAHPELPERLNIFSSQMFEFPFLAVLFLFGGFDKGKRAYFFVFAGVEEAV